MSAKFIETLTILAFLISMAGCATTPKKPHESKIKALENRISLLEAEVLKKDSQIINLTHALEKEKQEKEELLATVNEQKEMIEGLTEAIQEQERKTRSKTYYKSVIKVQTALRNAGFDAGVIDGKMGPRTRKALKEFQSSHGLPASGRLDKQTWGLLQKYLDGKK